MQALQGLVLGQSSCLQSDFMCFSHSSVKNRSWPVKDEERKQKDYCLD